jgi:fucose permease
VGNAYDISATTVNTISLVYMGVYLIMNFPSNYIIDKYGCRVGVVLGIVLTAIGMIIKCFINYSFTICVFGQMIAAIGQPFLTNAPAKVSALWFSEKGRIVATTIATVAMPLGVAVGFVIPALFVDDEDNLPQFKKQA